MKRETNQPKGHQISLYQQKTKIHLPNQSSDIFQKNTKNQQFLLFNFVAYPFQNQSRTPFKGVKTVLKAEQIKGNLQRLVSVNHQNIIQIQRVAKSNVRATPQSKAETYYSIYYEFIPFSLRKIAQASKVESPLLPDINASDLCNKLVEVCEYLMEIDINLLIRLEDIGVTQDGEIKVYVSADAIVKNKDHMNKINKRDVMGNIDRIMGWWGASVANRNRKPSRKSEDGPISNSLGFAQDSKDINKPKISTSFIEKSSKQTNQQNQQLKIPKQAFSTPEKIRRLEDEVKQIKAIMAQKIKGRIEVDQAAGLEQRVFLPEKTKNKDPLSKNRGPNQTCPEKQVNPGSNQSFQQNINCINIYNHLIPGSLKQSLQRIKKLQTQQIYSFKIESHKQDHQPKNYNKIIHLNTFPEDFHPLEDEDQNLSIDTYEMDLGQEFEPRAADCIEPFRMSLKSPKRDTSERNYNHNKQQARNQSKITNNQVVATKKVTQSAGPLQFKNFILQHIKPQFLAKRSNIYEDPGEYDSEKSYSLSKKASNYIKQLTQAGKSAASYHEKSSSAKRSKENEVQSFSKRKNQQAQYKMKAINGPKQTQQLLEPTNTTIQQYEKKFIKNQRSEAVILTKVQQLSINDKVKAALDKTKNAIALLNKVKSAKNSHISK